MKKRHLKGWEAVVLQLIERHQLDKENDAKLFLSYLREVRNLPYLRSDAFIPLWEGIIDFPNFDRMLRKVREKARKGKYADSELYALSEEEWNRRHGSAKQMRQEVMTL